MKEPVAGPEAGKWGLCTLDVGEPFGMGLHEDFGTLPLHVLKNQEWREETRKAIRSYVAASRDKKRCPWHDLVTVVRFPLSPVLAFRKFLDEQWNDPDVPQSKRMTSALDKAALERFESLRDTVEARFQMFLAKVDKDCP